MNYRYGLRKMGGGGSCGPSGKLLRMKSGEVEGFYICASFVNGSHFRIEPDKSVAQKNCFATLLED